VDINIKELENCKREFEAILTYEELLPHFEKALLDYRKKVQLPGFRKGKAPLALVKKQYGDAVEYYALEDIANDVFRNHLMENNIPIFGSGEIKDLDYKPKEKLTVKVEFEVIPDVNAGNIKGIELTRTNYVVDESLVDEELHYMKYKNASFEMDGIASDTEYMVTVDTAELDGNDNPVEGKSEKDLRFYLGSGYLNAEYYEALTGIKENEEKIINTKNQSGEDVRLKLKCTKIEKIIYPELNEENLKKFTGRDDIKTEDELRVFLKEEIKRSYDEHGKQTLRNKLVSEVVKLNDFSIPGKYVEALLDDYFKNYKKEHKGHNHDINETEFKNKNRAEVTFTGKWFLLKDKIIEQEKITVTDEDLKAFAEEAAKPYNIPADKLYEIYKENEEVKHQVLDRKVIDFLIENANITEVEEVKKSIKKIAEDKAKEENKDKKNTKKKEN
jgi:trigger factor